jgi:hypothetical protein
VAVQAPAAVPTRERASMSFAVPVVLIETSAFQLPAFRLSVMLVMFSAVIDTPAVSRLPAPTLDP